MNQRVVASIEARMGSSRLPGKVLTDVHGVPALTRLLRRLRACSRLDDVVLATSTSPADDALEAWALCESVAVSRGSEEDVLQRVVDAQAQMNSDVIVEVTGDCPLLDPELIDLAVDTFFANECDVVTNVRVPSFPQGADFQVFRRNDLAHVAATVNDPAVREHVSLYFYEHPERYRIVHVLAPPSLCAPNLRLQLDYPEDLQFIREVYARLEPTLGGTFGVSAILELLEQEPALARINADCEERPLR